MLRAITISFKTKTVHRRCDRNPGFDHSVNGLSRIFGLEIDAADCVLEKDNLKSLHEAFEHSFFDTIIGSQSADINPFDSALPQKIFQRRTARIRGSKSGVTILVCSRPFG